MKIDSMNDRLIFLLLHVVVFSQCAAAAEPDISNVRAIVDRALPYIQSGGMEWRTEQKCASCHRTTFTTWALNRAAESGLAVDVDAVRDWNVWSRDWINHVAEKRRDAAKRDETLLAENDSVGQLLMGRPLSEKSDDAWVVEYRDFLLKSQNADGSWKAGGQLPLQKRPQRETQEVSTMWALVTLHDSGAADDVIQLAVSKGTKWLGRKTQAKSIEWWATRLLLQRASGSADASEQPRETILSHQNDDGGWGWLIKDKSDALGTGIALYALAKDSAAVDEREISKALAFLRRTQDQDGSWSVNGTKKNSADDVTDTAMYWGACWAVIAMCELVDGSEVAVTKGGGN